jgi:endonuclease/exonuclease/phosphatase (EEP) superfamily protein YafD
LGISRQPHWFVRGWDFPRAQIALLLVMLGALHLVGRSELAWYDGLYLAAVAGALGWQSVKIFPYTRLARRQVVRARTQEGAPRLRLATSNVLMDNRQFDRWLEVICHADPDVILAIETNHRWADHLQRLAERYPYAVRQPQENMYGMCLFSRLKLIEPTVRFIVQDDIPSIHATVEVASGVRVKIIGLHPRPPEPLRDQDSVPRDAELVIVAKEIARNRQPTIVFGDLNDVAWSHTTKLFLRLSRLLDPRRGRGFYNTFSANHRFFRFPLDHVFHSDCFTLIRLERLPHVGSDHFPILIELCYQPEAAGQQPKMPVAAAQEQEAEEKVDLAEQQQGGLRPQSVRVEP